MAGNGHDHGHGGHDDHGDHKPAKQGSGQLGAVWTAMKVILGLGIVTIVLSTIGASGVVAAVSWIIFGSLFLIGLMSLFLSRHFFWHKPELLVGKIMSAALSLTFVMIAVALLGITVVPMTMLFLMRNGLM